MNKFDLKLDAEVFGLDKPCGHLTKIAINPETGQVTNLIIESGLLFKRTSAIPITRLEGIMTQAIYLALNSDELINYPEYQETAIAKDMPAQPRPLTDLDIQITEPHYSLTGIPEMRVAQEKIRTGVADEMILLDHKTPVYGLDEKIGQLSHIITTNNFQIHQLVVTQGKLLPKQIVIPARLVETISKYRIHILADKNEIDEFPEFIALNSKSTKPN